MSLTAEPASESRMMNAAQPALTDDEVSGEWKAWGLA